MFGIIFNTPLRIGNESTRPTLRASRGVGASFLIRIEQMTKMLLAEDNDMIKAVSPDRTDEPLRIAVLPWRPCRDRSIPYPHGARRRMKASTTELAYWAARLQVSPTYLAELLEKAFCAMETKRDRVIARDHTRPFRPTTGLTSKCSTRWCNRSQSISLDPELMGPVAAIGIIKGKPFAPDARMKKIMTEALALAKTTSRSLFMSPRDPSWFLLSELVVVQLPVRDRL